MVVHHLSSLLVVHLVPVITDLGYTILQEIAERISSSSYVNCLNTHQLRLMIQLAADTLLKTSLNEQKW